MQNELLLNLIQNNVQALWGLGWHLCAKSRDGLVAILGCHGPRQPYSCVCTGKDFSPKQRGNIPLLQLKVSTLKPKNQIQKFGVWLMYSYQD